MFYVGLCSSLLVIKVIDLVTLIWLFKLPDQQSIQSSGATSSRKGPPSNQTVYKSPLPGLSIQAVSLSLHLLLEERLHVPGVECEG